MRRNSILFISAVFCCVITTILLAQQDPAEKAAQVIAKTLPTPTGRTLDDVRQAYTSKIPVSARASVATETPPLSRPPKIVEAEVFALTDRQGNVRAELGACETGTKMQMFDAKCKVRLLLAETSGVATVTLVGKDGQPGLELRLSPDGDAMISLGPHGPKSTPPLTLQVNPYGNPKVSLRNIAGEESLRLSSHPDEGGMVEVFDAGAGGRLKADSLSLRTPQGGPRASLCIPNRNGAQLNMSRGDGSKTELELGCAGEASWLRMNTKEYGSADLRTSEDGTSLALKPRSGEGGLVGSTRLKDSKVVTDLFLSDIDGLQKIKVGVRGGKPSLSLWGEEQGKPALFNAP